MVLVPLNFSMPGKNKIDEGKHWMPFLDVLSYCVPPHYHYWLRCICAMWLIACLAAGLVEYFCVDIALLSQCSNKTELVLFLWFTQPVQTADSPKHDWDLPNSPVPVPTVMSQRLVPTAMSGPYIKRWNMEERGFAIFLIGYFCSLCCTQIGLMVVPIPTHPYWLFSWTLGLLILFKAIVVCAQP